MNRILLIGLVFISITVDAQTLPSVQTIKSPESAAIDQVIETPVSYSTGTPNISIPLYEIDIKGVKVPISLNYTAGGVRVDQEATWVGLGWSLNYGGQISRTVEGKPDEYAFFNAGTNPSYSSYSIASFLTLPDWHTDCYMLNRVENIFQAKNANMYGDYMPDEFYYSALGHSGRFMFNQENAKFVLFPKDDLKFNYNYSSTSQTYSGENNYYPIASWTMQAPDGTLVTFGQDGTSSSGSVFGGPGSYVTNTWMIKTIQNRFNEEIYYTYSPFTDSLSKLSGQTYSYQAKTITTNVNQYAYNDANLKSISFPDGSIQFITTTRLDLPTQALSEIDILNPSGQIIRRINFKYSYFTGDDGDINTVTNDNSFANSGTFETSRLRLDTLTISNAGVQPLNYEFSYYTPSVLPSKNSVDQDFWGFFNGQKGNTTLIPLMFNNQTQFGERQVDSNYNNAFSLHTIAYPTGGKTEYIYESNTALGSNIPLYLQQDLQTQGQGASDVIEVACFGRSTSYSPPAPDSVGPFGERYFRSTFAIPPGGGIAPLGNNWQCITNYVQNNTIDNSIDCSILNVEFLLEAQNSNGTYSTVKTFWDKNCTTNTLVGPDYESVSLFNGTTDTIYYRMSVVLWYPVISYNPFVYRSDLGDTNYYNETNFIISWLNPAPPASPSAYAKVGGLRIKTINSYNSDGSLAKQRSFSYTNSVGTTTGQLITIPTFYENVESATYGTDIKIFSNSVIPLQTNAGSYLGYTSVTEQVVGSSPAESLTTQYTYSFTPSQNDPIYGYWNQGVLDGQEWNRGQLLSAKYLKNGNPVKTENYSYYSYSPNLASSYSDTTTINLNEDYVDEINTNFISYAVLRPSSEPTLDVSDFFDVSQENYGGFPADNFDQIYWFYSVANTNLPIDGEICPNSIFQTIYSNVNSVIPIYAQTLPYFKRYTGFAKPQSKVTITYDDSGHSLTETENYFYDETPALYQLTRSRHVTSKGDTLQLQTKYPTDFSSVVPYDSMVTRNMLNSPVVQTETKNGNFLQSQTSNYQFWNYNLIAPFSVQTQVGSNPMDTRFQYYGYDTVGNILSESKAGDQLISYLYDYNHQYLIAKTANANATDIAYTSFEAGGTGNWAIGSGSVDSTTAITGVKSYNLTGNITASGLNSSTTYIVSYWTTNNSPFSILGTMSGYPVQGKTEIINNNSWTLYVHKVTGQSTITVSGSGHIDELRLYPVTAQMTTYTYAPLVGMTSQADVGNRVTYYEYDGLQRLKRIRDQDYNIVKTFDYQYLAPAGCGNGCTILTLQTFLGTNTPGYPVGVFDIHGNLIGNATGATNYVSLWNSDTADTRIGTLAAGADSMHFNLSVNSGQTAPANVTGCRYYQYDLPWNNLDGITCGNGAYVDFGDSIHMTIPPTYTDTPAVMPPRTTHVGFFNQFDQQWWFDHTYPDNTLKTITIYHNDDAKAPNLDDGLAPATSLMLVRNLRGNIPQQSTAIGGSCFQQASALTVANITNWNTISSITGFWPHCGDKINPCENMSYTQDFMANNHGLTTINTTQLNTYYMAGYRDTTFKLTRLKSNWNTYFTNLQDVEISDDHWNREDLTALTQLATFALIATNQNHSNNATGNPAIPIPGSVIDGVINQIAAGAGQSISNGVIWILTGGSARTSASTASVAALDAKGWIIYIDSVLQ